MPHVPGHTRASERGTRTDLTPKDFEPTTLRKVQEAAIEAGDRADCLAKGGKWDPQTKTCVLPGQEFNINIEKALQAEPLTPPQETTQEEIKGEFDTIKGGFVTEEGQVFPTDNPNFRPSRQTDQNITFNQDGTVTLSSPDGEAVTLTQEEYDTFRGGGGNVTAAVQQARSLPNVEQFQAQQLAGQVGQFQDLSVSPTGFDFGEAGIVGLAEGIPSSIGWIGSTLAGAGGLGFALGGIGRGAAAGATRGAIAGPKGAIILGVAGAAISVLASLTQSAMNNLEQQRRDMTASQIRVLTEGKQVLNQFATQAAADPANRIFYLSQFNRQLALINQAYRRLKLDTQRDVLKFETAVPDIYEFEVFFNDGERDALVTDMQRAILGQIPPEEINFRMAELAQRGLGNE